MNASRLAALAAIVASLFVASAAHADPNKSDPKPAGKDSPSKNDAEAPPPKTTSLALAATPVLPVGRLGDAVGFGIGGVIEANFQLHPQASVIARTGYVHHFPRDYVATTLGIIPIWGGARFGFLGAEGPYVEAAAGPTIIMASVDTGRFGRVSDSDVRFGTSLGGGYRTGKLDIGGRMVFYDLGHAGDTMGLMASLGYSFAAF